MKFGKLPPKHDRRTFRSGLAIARHLDALGPAPPACRDYVAAVEDAVGGPGSWGMFRNDAVGLCTAADEAHALMLRTANASSLVVPPQGDVDAMYKATSGWNGVVGDPSDAGAFETDVCAWTTKSGLLGHVADVTAMIDPANLDHVRWVAILFGTVRLGITVTRGMMDQFDRGEPWDGSGDATILGGHDVPLVHYLGDTSYVVTWGRRVPALGKFWSFVEEAHASVYADWVRSQYDATAPSALKLDALVADLSSVAAGA